MMNIQKKSYSKKLKIKMVANLVLSPLLGMGFLAVLYYIGLYLYISETTFFIILILIFIISVIGGSIGYRRQNAGKDIYPVFEFKDTEIPEYVLEQSFPKRESSYKIFNSIIFVLLLFFLILYIIEDTKFPFGSAFWFLIMFLFFPLALIQRFWVERKRKVAYLNGIDLDAVVKDKYMGKRGQAYGAVNVPRLLVAYEVNGRSFSIEATVNQRIYDMNAKGEVIKIKINKQHPDIWVPVIDA